jgi:hypothetical protein
MPHTRQIPCPDAKAEGRIMGFAYNTELVNQDGVSFHVWLGKQVTGAKELMKQIEPQARNERDVVYFTYSDGEPTGYWAQEHIP